MASYQRIYQLTGAINREDCAHMSIYHDNRSYKWCMDIKVDDKRLQVHSPEQQLLVRMQSIIKTNKLTYDKAKRLAVDYRMGKIPAGYIGHQYLSPNLGYRIISAYVNNNGFIHTYYDNPNDAWEDHRIQSRIATAGVQHDDYDTYLNTVDSGHPWSLMGLTILRCRITIRGNLLTVKKSLE